MYKYRKSICLSPEDTHIYTSFKVSLILHFLLVLIRPPCNRDSAKPRDKHRPADAGGRCVRPGGQSPYQTAGECRPVHKSQQTHNTSIVYFCFVFTTTTSAGRRTKADRISPLLIPFANPTAG